MEGYRSLGGLPVPLPQGGVGLPGAMPPLPQYAFKFYKFYFFYFIYFSTFQESALAQKDGHMPTVGVGTKVAAACEPRSPAGSPPWPRRANTIRLGCLSKTNGLPRPRNERTAHFLSDSA